MASNTNDGGGSGDGGGGGEGAAPPAPPVPAPELNTGEKATWTPFVFEGREDEDEVASKTTPDDVLNTKRMSLRPDHAFAALFADGGPMESLKKPAPSNAVYGRALYLNGAPVEKPPGVTRFVCISDTHGRHRKIMHMPPGDVLLHAGDITNCGELRQLQDFSQWLSEQTQYTHKVVIAGNHDITLHREYYAQEHNRRRFHRYVRVRMCGVRCCRCLLLQCRPP